MVKKAKKVNIAKYDSAKRNKIKGTKRKNNMIIYDVKRQKYI